MLISVMRLRGYIAFMLAGFAGCGAVRAQNVGAGDFSLDGLSRVEVLSRFHAADLIDKTGANIHIAHQLLSMPNDPIARQSDIDAFSYGIDKLVPIGPGFFVSLEYSVQRESVGAGGIVSNEARGSGNGNAGDKFRLYVLRSGRVVGPWKAEDAEDINLTPLPSPDESEIDGISWPPGTKRPVYFSVNRDTAQKLGLDAATIYYVDDPSTNPAIKVYVTSTQLGLQPGLGPQGDNIDGLAIADGGLQGVFQPSDVIYVSLDFGGTHNVYFPPPSGDGIIQVSPAAIPPAFATPAGVGLPGAVILGPAQLDLSSTPRSDNLDAMTGFDPGPCWDERDPPPKDKEAAIEMRPWCEPFIE